MPSTRSSEIIQLVFAVGGQRNILLLTDVLNLGTCSYEKLMTYSSHSLKAINSQLYHWRQMSKREMLELFTETEYQIFLSHPTKFYGKLTITVIPGRVLVYM